MQGQVFADSHRHYCVMREGVVKMGTFGVKRASDEPFCPSILYHLGDEKETDLSHAFALHRKWLTLDIHNPFQSWIDLMKPRYSGGSCVETFYIGKNYENFPILPQGFEGLRRLSLEVLAMFLCMGLIL